MRPIIGTSATVLIIALGLLLFGSSPVSRAEQPQVAAPQRLAAIELFGDMPATTVGDATTHTARGTVAFRADGWIIVETDDSEEGMAFFAPNLGGYLLVDRQGMITIDANEAGGQAVFYFGLPGQEELEFSGTVALTYDEKAGHLTIEVSDQATLSVNLDLPGGNAGEPLIAVGTNYCECSYSGPKMSCNAKGECPSGYFARCTCNSGGCTKTCVRIKDIVEIPTPPEPVG